MPKIREMRQQMGGQSNATSVAVRRNPVGNVTLERMVKYLMEGNPVPTDLMLDLELNERVGWKLSWCETKVSQELRRYGFVLEHKGDLYSARKYR